MQAAGLQRLRTVAGSALTRTSPRERWLAVLLGLVLLAGLAFQAWSWTSAQRDRAISAQADLALARQAGAQARRDTLNGFDRAQLQALSDWSLKGGNIWIVRLKVEQSLSAAADAAGIHEAEVQVAEAAEGQGGLPLLRAEVGGPYVKSNLAELLRRIYADRQAVLIDRLQVEDQGQPQFRLTLLYPLDPKSFEVKR
jgi:hypothetical protein